MKRYRTETRDRLPARRRDRRCANHGIDGLAIGIRGTCKFYCCLDARAVFTAHVGMGLPDGGLAQGLVNAATRIPNATLLALKATAAPQIASVRARSAACTARSVIAMATTRPALTCRSTSPAA